MVSDRAPIHLRLLETVQMGFSNGPLIEHNQTLFSNCSARFVHGQPCPISNPTSIGPEWSPFQRRRFTSKINKIDGKLAEIVNSRKLLRLRAEDGMRREASSLSALLSHTGPCHDQASILGRENDKNEILDLLISAKTSASALGTNFTVVPIHGAAGIGKTTLARMVYNDPRLNYFGIKAWVCLTERCDVNTAMTKIYEQMTGHSWNGGDFGMLQKSLRDYLEQEKNEFLLVIDDFWAIHPRFWEMLRVPLLAGREGSIVLITTRYHRTCQIMPELIQRPSLTGLDEEYCWQIIRSLALPQGIINNDHSKLVPIGKEIARRCHGSPMAAKGVGTILIGRSDEEWSDVLSEMRALKYDFNGAVLSSLKISYYHLNYHMKQCFAYCSIFPNGYLFERDQLIRYWMAEGLIVSDGRHRLEAVGRKHLDDLIWRSFFEKITIGTRQVERYRIPSLMHDLAKLVSQYEFCCLESGKPLPDCNLGNPYQVRYASFLQPKNRYTVELECLLPYSNLRTLKFCHEFNKKVLNLNSIRAPFFRKFKHLRVLDMSNSDLRLVPDSVGELIHLRFLGLSNTKIQTLPEKICNLFNLQSLELKGCWKLKVLPEGMRRLINLRHLDLHLDWEEITDSTEVALPQGIGELKGLQTLSRFNATSAEGPLCNISELINLNLRGDLSILNLEKLSTGYSYNAILREKHFIEKLMLRWHSSSLNDEMLQQQSEEVINLLQPCNSLRNLWIENYPGTKFPDWMGDASFSSLEKIRISNCRNSSFLPLLGQLSSLRNLLIDCLPGDTITMPGGFPSLEHLQFNFSSFQRLSLENEIPNLKKIDVSDCPC